MKKVLAVTLLLTFELIVFCEDWKDIWKDAGRMTGFMWQSCMQKNIETIRLNEARFFPIMLQCVKRRSLIVLDRSLNDDVIRLSNNIELVRNWNINETVDDAEARSLNGSPIAKANQLIENETDWKAQVLYRLAHVFRTHVLKIRLNGHEGSHSVQSEGRGRRKRQSMMLSLMMFGVVAVGLVVIPMGFQFLAVLGGKALLLAKMALLLTSIQGLKKIATSNLNYGLYSTGGDHSQGNWHYDRQWPFEAPESLDVNRPYNYYDPAEQQTDLLHPRNDGFKNIMK